MRGARDDRDDGKREFEQSESEHAPRPHFIEQSGIRLGRDIGGDILLGWRTAIAPGPDEFPQALALDLRQIGKFQVVAPARPGLEFYLDEPEQPRHELLFNADVLNSLIRYRPRLARQNPAFHPDVVCSDRIGEARPTQIGEEYVRSDRQHDKGEEVEQGIAEIAFVQDGESADDEWQDKLRQHGHSPHCKRARVCSAGRVLQRFGHRVSRLIAARISSRMAVASAWRRPGSDTEALCVPAVWTVRVASP